jgi:hypothetical protein
MKFKKIYNFKKTITIKRKLIKSYRLKKLIDDKIENQLLS